MAEDGEEAQRESSAEKKDGNFITPVKPIRHYRGGSQNESQSSGGSPGSGISPVSSTLPVTPPSEEDPASQGGYDADGSNWSGRTNRTEDLSTPAPLERDRLPSSPVPLDLTDIIIDERDPREESLADFKKQPPENQKSTPRILSGQFFYQELFQVCKVLRPSEKDPNPTLAAAVKARLNLVEGIREKLVNLLDYLNSMNVDPKTPTLEDPRYVAYLNARAYSDQIKALLESDSLSEYDEIKKHIKLVFTLIFQLKRLKGDAEFKEDDDPILAEKIIDFGKESAQQLPTEKWKVVAGCALIVLGALTAWVAVATVVALLINPATTPVAAALAVPFAKFGLEASIVACLYFLAEMVNYLKNKKNEWSLLPDSMTTTQKLCAVLKPGCPTWAQVKTGMTVGALVGAPSANAAVGAIAGVAINPASVGVTSGFANATVATATTSASVVSVLTAIPLTFFAAFAMIKRGRCFISDRRHVPTLAENVLNQQCKLK